MLRASSSICDKARPGWDGTPVGPIDEALFLAGTPAALVLFLATALVLRYRSQWGGVAIVVGWTLFATMLTMIDPGGLRANGQIEGCTGAPTLFLALVAAICVGTILYTAPVERDS